MFIHKFKDDVSGNFAAATEEEPLIIHRYSSPYRAVVPFELWERAEAALREKEAQEQEAAA